MFVLNSLLYESLINLLLLYLMSKYEETNINVIFLTLNKNDPLNQVIFTNQLTFI